jgi:hypothetical protein
MYDLPGDSAMTDESPTEGEDEPGRELLPSDIVEPWMLAKPWRFKFIETFSKTGNVALSCREAQISRNTVYDDLRDHPDFAQAFAHARETAADALEQIAWQRATVGVNQLRRRRVADPVTGELRTVEEEEIVRKTSDTLLIFLLNGMRPWKYRSNVQVRQEISGPDGGPVRVEVERARSPERLRELLQVAVELGWDPRDEQPPGLALGYGEEPATNGDSPVSG